MKKLDNLDNDQEYTDAVTDELSRSFQILNAGLDEKWFENITNPQKKESILSEEKIENKPNVEDKTYTENKKNTEKKNYQEKTLRNNGKEIGKVRVYNKHLKRTLLIASFIVVGVSSYMVGKTTKVPNYQVNYNTLTNDYFDEPTYNGILYTVKPGDNLDSIVSHYEKDANKKTDLIRQIMSYNNLKTSKIVDGCQIVLFGVPSSMLEEYGYSDNFNYFDPFVEINVRFDFLDKVAMELSKDDANQSYVRSISDLKEWYQQFKYSYIPGENQELNEILNECRELSELASDYGFDFEYNKKAMPLSEAINYKKNVGRTNN